MKIALIALPNPVLANPSAHFPQSLLYVSSALLHAGHQVKIVDLRARRYVTEAIILEVSTGDDPAEVERFSTSQPGVSY